MILMNNDDTVHSIGHIEQTVSVMMQLLLMIEVMVLAASSGDVIGDMMVSWDYRRKMVLMVTTHLIRVKMVMMTGDMKVMTVATRRLVREKKLVSDVFRMMVM
ncbi:MAG: hypothetical protein NTX21_07590 [Alphaproteobacteria bacterium]|nr:hypothetical protein [Alphaproteobacteria bacterium]